MQKYLLPLLNLPEDGKEVTIDDQSVWLDRLREFKMDCRVISPLKSRLTIWLSQDGCLIRGTLEGTVAEPCNRCAEDAIIEINSSYDEFEEIPEEPRGPHKGENSESHIVFDEHTPMLNLAEVAWEQFMLSIPVNPLCKPDCKGLCTQCGANLNQGSCSCAHEESDPRMAALRNLKIDR